VGQEILFGDVGVILLEECLEFGGGGMLLGEGDDLSRCLSLGGDFRCGMAVGLKRWMLV